MATREQILKWYASFVEEMKAPGIEIDMNNPADLLRIKSFEEKGYPESEFEMSANVFLYGHVMLEEPRKVPNISRASQVDYKQYKKLYDIALSKMKKAEKGLEEAKNGGAKTPEELQAAVDEMKEAVRIHTGAHDSLDKLKSQIYEPIDRFLLTHVKPIDPSKDFARIEELYNLASEGRLIVQGANNERLDKHTVAIAEDGTAAVSITFNSKDMPQVSYQSVEAQIAKNPQARADAEAKLGTTVGTFLTIMDAPKKPKEPDKIVPKPGFGAWMKRIFSFGVVKTDFVAYEQNQQEWATYEDKKAAYPTELEQWKAVAKVNNESVREKCETLLDDKAAQVFPGKKVLHAGKIVCRLIQSVQSEGAMYREIQDPIYERDILDPSDPSIEVEKDRHISDVLSIAHKHPDMFNPDGSRNPEKYDEAMQTVAGREEAQKPFRQALAKAMSGVDECMAQLKAATIAPQDKHIEAAPAAPVAPSV